MIRLPAPLTPSGLLCCEGLSPFIDRLLEGSCALLLQERPGEAERCVLEALGPEQGMGTPLDRAVALVHLGDIHREMGSLSLALGDYRRAERTLRCQPAFLQRHNEAVATYALGLAHHSLGSETEALEWYDRSTELLGMAKAHWTTVNGLKRLDDCSRLEHWMALLSDCLIHGITCAETGGPSDVWVPVVLAERGGSYVEQVEIQEEDGELVGRVNRFQVHPLEGGWSIRLAPDRQYDAQKVSEEIRQTLDAARADHALIQWDDPSAPYSRHRVDTLGKSEPGGFVRNADGSIYVVRRAPRIIGGGKAMEQARVGWVAALLEPVSGHESAYSSGNGPTSPPRRQRSDEVIRLYNKLLGLVGGSRGTASSLVEHEREQAPHVSLGEAIERAISRLLRDRRSTN